MVRDTFKFWKEDQIFWECQFKEDESLASRLDSQVELRSECFFKSLGAFYQSLFKVAEKVIMSRTNHWWRCERVKDFRAQCRTLIDHHYSIKIHFLHSGQLWSHVTTWSLISKYLIIYCKYWTGDWLILAQSPSIGCAVKSLLLVLNTLLFKVRDLRNSVSYMTGTIVKAFTHTRSWIWRY